jgi:hypothetical protein
MQRKLQKYVVVIIYVFFNFVFFIIKWLPESSPSKTSTPIRIDNKNQFAPLSEDPKELKNHQKQVNFY